MHPNIDFELSSEEIVLPEGFSPKNVRFWLNNVALKEHKVIKSILFIFCDDAYLIDLNQQYLKHDTLTDIITFPYHTDPIEAEIYISIERVMENAHTYGDGDESLELARVLVHGLLHMCGLSDDTELEKSHMRSKETDYLQELINLPR